MNTLETEQAVIIAELTAEVKRVKATSAMRYAQIKDFRHDKRWLKVFQSRMEGLGTFLTGLGFPKVGYELQDRPDWQAMRAVEGLQATRMVHDKQSVEGIYSVLVYGKYRIMNISRGICWYGVFDDDAAQTQHGLHDLPIQEYILLKHVAVNRK